VDKDGRVLILRRIHVTYRLAVDPDVERDKVERVLRMHAQHCPVYRSIHPQIHVTTALELVAT
jgi:uncharacterized OsmC-like protein